MKNTKWMLNGALTALLIAAAGCATTKSGSASLEGKWKGNEILGDRTQGPCSLTFHGKDVEYHGYDANDWAKGTVTYIPDTKPSQLLLQFTDAPSAETVGKTCHIIYEVKGDTLDIAGNAPGVPEAPASFDAPGTRHFIFKKERTGVY